MERWIIVSNRLPFSFDNNSESIKPSSGGLVTAISGIQSANKMLWVGSIPAKIPENILEQYSKSVGMEFLPIEIEAKLYDSYYNDFCNDVLWPILHYEVDHIKFREKSWNDYRKVNQLFAEEILKIATPEDIIWIQDFHFFLVPELIKLANPELRVGFFLHVPFPSSEIYRQLPCREEILKSLIYSDLVGFHDYSYLRHFASSVYHVLGIHSNLLEVKIGKHICKLGVYPVSIDTQQFINYANQPKTQWYVEEYCKNKKEKTYILGVDRLDYTKGILLKLKAFQLLLEENPSLVGRVQLVQIAVPSRTEVPEYIELRSQVERLVGEINGRFSTMNYLPVRYIFNSVNTYELMALYQVSEMLFITSKRDGMNLVCLEYIASQIASNPGVILLSEFAGAASTLSHIIRINPHDIYETSRKIVEALELPFDERKKRHEVMLSFLKGYTASDWAGSFIKDLKRRSSEIKTITIDLEKDSEIKDLLRPYKGNKTLLLLDYDGTLAPIQSLPEQAIISERAKRIISKLSSLGKYDIVIVSGRHVNFLKEQFSGIDLFIAGEHGGIFYDYKRQRWRVLVSTGQNTWYNDVLEILEGYTKRTPNSFIETKEYAVCWHYRNCPGEFGEFQARKLVIDLEATLSNHPVNVIKGKKVVEVKAIEANKGYFTHWFVERYLEEGQKIIAIGDDKTDEDMFAALGPECLTIKVGGPLSTNARYNLSSQSQVIEFLEYLAN